jgi:hypothetical protein
MVQHDEGVLEWMEKASSDDIIDVRLIYAWVAAGCSVIASRDVWGHYCHVDC